MAINGISNVNSTQVLKINESVQDKNTNKLSSGFKVNRNDDTAATLSIKSNNASAAENVSAFSSNINDIDKVDEMIAQARKNILSKPEESILAQANQGTAEVVSLVQ